MNNKIIKIINYLFVIIFGILLIIPTLKIDMSSISYYENKALAQFPSLQNKKGKINMQFCKEFDDWFNSRINMRYQLIKFYKMFSCALNVNYCIDGEDKVFDKRNNVLYINSFFGIYSDGNAKNEKIIKISTANSFQKINDFCKKKGIKFYVLVIPRRADFVTYNTPVRKFKNSHDFAEDIVDYVKIKTDVNIIYPYEELSEANKNNAVYYKTDHHWSQYGAYIGYSVLMQNIKKDLPDIHIENLNDFVLTKDKRVKTTHDGKFHSGSMVRMAGFPEFFVNKVLDKDYLYFYNSKSNDMNYMQYPEMPYLHNKIGFYVKNPYLSKRKALLIGDSFTANLINFLPYSFSDIAIYSINREIPSYKDIKQIIDIFKPDVVIINVRSFLIGMFFKMFSLQNTKQGEQ